MGILSENEIRELIRVNMRPYEQPIAEGKTVRITDRESFRIVRKIGGGTAAEHYLGEMDPILRDIVSKARKNSIATEEDVKEYLKGCRVQAFAKVPGKNRRRKYKFPIDPEMVKADKNVTQPEFLDKIYKNYYRFGVAAIEYSTMNPNVRSALEDATAIDLPEFGKYDPQNVEFVLSFINAQNMTAADKDLERVESQARREGESDEDFEKRTGRKFTTVTRGKEESSIDFEKRTGISANKQGIKPGGSFKAELKPKPYLVQRSKLKKAGEKDPEVQKIIDEIEGFEERYRLQPLGYEIVYFDKNKKPAVEVNPAPLKRKERPKGTVIVMKDFRIEVPEGDGSKKVSVPEAEFGMSDMFAEVYDNDLLLKKNGKGADTLRVKNQIRALHEILKSIKLEGFDPSKFTLTGDVYTQDTHDAVEAYQKAMKKQKGYEKMTVDGKVGRQTITSMDSNLKGKLIPITGEDYTFGPDEAERIGLPQISANHTPKMYEVDRTTSYFEYLSGPHSKDDQNYLAYTVLNFLQRQKDIQSVGHIKINIDGLGERISDDPEKMSDGSKGKVVMSAKDTSLDFTAVSEKLVKILFQSRDVDELTGEEKLDILSKTVMHPGEKGKAPKWSMMFYYVPKTKEEK